MTAKKSKKKTKKTSPKTNKKKPKQQSFIGRAIKYLLVLTIWGSIFLGGTILWFAKDLPDITQSAVFERRTSLTVTSSNGTVLARYGESKGNNISVSDMPNHLIHAILATEDRRFYDHFGIDLIGISRAMAINLMKGRFVQGGSTITQQLAKNLFLTHDRKITRKIKEAILAVWLERELTKDEILSAYMNRVYLGSGTYGFDAAAQLYFGKSASDVNLHESMILAGLLKAPSKYSPLNNLDLAKERAQVVQTAMIDAGWLKKSDMTSENMILNLPNQHPENSQNIRYFTDWVIEGIDDLVGRPDIDMVIETTLNNDIQNHAQNAISAVIKESGTELSISQGASIVMQPDGAILSMVGGYDYGKSQFNRATLATRPPGSAFKPVVYLSALQQGWSPNDIILDSPITDDKYKPSNFGNKYYGEVTLETALANSMNTATVRLARAVGIGNVIKTAKDLGIYEKLDRNLSLALGSTGIPILQIATAYTVIANGGYRVYPYAINRITEKQSGRILYERKAPKSYQRVINGNAVNNLKNMMQSVINNGTGKAARLPYPASGKTGTSQDSRDAWFAGFTDRVISVVWLGNDNNSPMKNVTGGSAPARIWRENVSYAQNIQPTQNIPEFLIENNPTFSSDDNAGFSNLLGRLISGGNNAEKTKPTKSPYENLND